MPAENPILDALQTSVIIDRKDRPGQAFWTEWRTGLVLVGGTQAQAGDLAILGPNGKFDPSVIPASGNGFFTLVAGQNIVAYQVVAVHGDGQAYVADVGNVSDASRVVGIAVTSAPMGQPVQIQQIGPVSNLGWSFTPGTMVFVGFAGTLVQTPSIGTFELPMGVATSVTQVEAQIGLSIVFA